MKEMPERIYLFDYNEATTTPLDGDTEYIRKDIVDDMIKTAEDHAFFAGSEYARKEVIENACKFLKEHREEVRTEDNGIAGWIPERFIEDFKEYMNENS